MYDIRRMINSGIASDFFHECLETIFALIQDEKDYELVDSMINNGLLKVIKTCLKNFAQIDF